MMSESCLIGVNNALKFTDKNEINKMFITVNATASRAAIEWTFVSFTLGRGGISCRNGVFVWWSRRSWFDTAWEFGMKCLVSLEKVSKILAVELSYERNNLACCWFKIALLRWVFWVSETQILSRLKIVDSDIPKQQDCTYFRSCTWQI